jgi:hypothetical protein
MPKMMDLWRRNVYFWLTFLKLWAHDQLAHCFWDCGGQNIMAGAEEERAGAILRSPDLTSSPSAYLPRVLMPPNTAILPVAPSMWVCLSVCLVQLLQKCLFTLQCNGELTPVICWLIALFRAPLSWSPAACSLLRMCFHDSCISCRCGFFVVALIYFHFQYWEWDPGPGTDQTSTLSMCCTFFCFCFCFCFETGFFYVPQVVFCL